MRMVRRPAGASQTRIPEKRRQGSQKTTCTRYKRRMAGREGFTDLFPGDLMTAAEMVVG